MSLVLSWPKTPTSLLKRHRALTLSDLPMAGLGCGRFRCTHKSNSYSFRFLSFHMKEPLYEKTLSWRIYIG